MSFYYVLLGAGLTVCLIDRVGLVGRIGFKKGDKS